MNRLSIALAMPPNNGIFKVIEANLRHHGFRVVSLVLPDDRASSQPSLPTRLEMKFRRLLLGQRDAEVRMRAEWVRAAMLPKVAAMGDVDYALFIRGDLFSLDVLDRVRGHVRTAMVNYQWDSMHRYPAIWPTVERFDRFFVFDPADWPSKDNDFLPATNFYFDDDLDHRPPTTADFYFTGCHQPSRTEVVKEFARVALRSGWQLDFNIFWWDPRTVDQARAIYSGKDIASDISILTTPMDFRRNLEQARQAAVLVDFVDIVHRGLSFRTFEALAYRKKLLTTNPDVRRYEFYHPDNIHIIEDNNFGGIADFMRRPYCEIDPAIREKYAFGNWIRYILDLQPHQRVSFPTELFTNANRTY